ncbi:hypothetical protein F511_25857 [Dorcoceras hygrometricum]|uniref:Uncharacterized protein n=1 Tax=Dorcoceras hygrometricum TaxID=472368 RepID=A0A2Z7B8F8_9LAMI|nr:hypothetical protein F511_25857 [Dorcoceras hygrometricum]
MSLFDLQDVCIAIGSIATLDLPMVVDLIGIYGLKGPYCMLTTTDWFLQTLSVIPRGSWGDVARRFTMIRWAGDVTEMRSQFSGSDEPFKASNKKKEMKIEFRLLHDVVAKTLYAKAGSFDQVLTSKSVQTYMKKNLDIKPTGESSKHNEDTANNTEGGESQGARPVERAKDTIKKKLTTAEEPRNKKQKVPTQPVEARSKTTPEMKGNKGVRRGSRKMNPLILSLIFIYQSRILCEERGLRGLNTTELNFRKEVRIKDISSFEHLIKIEEKLLEWGETEKVSELFERRSLILYKLYELEVEKLYDEHLDNFKLDVPSVNHDHLCIRCLNKELKLIATLHRAQHALASLPVMDPEATSVGLVSNQPPVLTLEFSSQAEQEQAADHASIQLNVQQDSEAMKFQEHQAHENEPQDQADENQALDDEHQAHCKHNYLDAQQEQQGSGGNPTPIENPPVNIVDTANNPRTLSTFDEHGPDHQSPSPSNLRVVTFTPDSEEDTRLSFLESSESSHAGSQRMFIPDSPEANSKLDEVDKVVSSIDLRMIYMEYKLTSVDSRMLYTDSKLKSMEFKLRSMNSQIEQLLDTQTFLKLDFRQHKGIIYDKVDTLDSIVKSSQTALETSLTRQLARQQQQFTNDLDMVKLQLAELVEHHKRIGNDKKGLGGQSRPREGLNRPGEEGSSDGHHSIRVEDLA